MRGLILITQDREVNRESASMLVKWRAMGRDPQD
jgi:hypothetical protein